MHIPNPWKFYPRKLALYNIIYSLHIITAPFYSDVTVFSSSVFLGVILVYSTERRASLSVLKYLLPKLPKVPLMIIAMTTAESHNEELLKEGEELAQEKEAMFLVNTAPELPSKTLE